MNEERNSATSFREFMSAWYLYFWEYRSCRHIDKLARKVRKHCHKVTGDELLCQKIQKSWPIIKLIVGCGLWFTVEHHKTYVQGHMIELSNIMEGLMVIIAEAPEGEDTTIFHEYYEKAKGVYKIYERLNKRLMFIWRNWW